VALRADDAFQWDGDHVLFSPFPDSYRPQWKEKLDMIARQIGAKWSYNHDTGYWMLHQGPMPYPYTVEIAEGWKQRDQGNHVVFIPPIAPVGMDIYVLGHYTPTSKDDTKTFEDARANAAMMWASRINEAAAVKNMETRQVDGEDALYFQSPTPRSADMIWRQWSVVKNGWSILIVSVMDAGNEAALLPQVEAMVKSVRIGGVKAPSSSKDAQGSADKPATSAEPKAK